MAFFCVTEYYICQSCLITGHRYLLMWREFTRLLFLLRIGGDSRRRRYCLCWLLRYRLWSSSRTGTVVWFIVSNHRGQTSFDHVGNPAFFPPLSPILLQRPLCLALFQTKRKITENRNNFRGHKNILHSDGQDRIWRATKMIATK